MKILWDKHKPDVSNECTYIRAQNNDLSQVIFRPTLVYDRAKSNLVGHTLLYISNGEVNNSL